MAGRRRERIEHAALAPLSWRLGWAKGYAFMGLVACWIFLAPSIGPRLAAWASIGGGWLGFATVAALSLAFVGAFFCPARLVLDEEGVAIRGYGRERFVAYAKIAKADLVQRLGAGLNRRGEPARWNVYSAVRLLLRDDTVIDVPLDARPLELPGQSLLSVGAFGQFAAYEGSVLRVAQTINARIREEREGRPSTSPMIEALQRGRRSVAAWRTALANAASAPADAYRGGDAASEALWRVLEDDDAPRDARAGAAVALRTHLDDDGRRRMRVVVDGCESPKLRVAVETALDETADDAALKQALEIASEAQR